MKALSPRIQQRRRTLERALATFLLLIIGAATLPPLFHLARERALSGASVAFYGALGRARLAAIDANQRVVLCARAPDDARAPRCSGSGQSWREGWIAFATTRNTTSFDSARDRLLEVSDPLPRSVWIGSSDLRTAIAFRPDGSVVGERALTLEVGATDRIATARLIDISRRGVLRLTYAEGHLPGPGAALVASHGP